MQKHITIPERFRGPPTSGNGGYVAGAFAEQVQQNPDQAVEVTLRAPIPLNATMSVHRHDAADRASVTIEIDADSTSALSTTKTLIAEVRLQPFSLDIPTPPTYQQALAIRHLAVPLQQRQDSPMPGSLGLHPICFCCGAGHPTGLQVYAAPLQTGQVAAAWQTRAEWADSDGLLPARFLWTALDCPGQLAYFHAGQLTGLLGRMTARVHGTVRAGEPLVVTAWPINVDGKKHFAGSAIFNQKGELIAQAIAVWIGKRAMTEGASPSTT
ncbi:MAG: hotdog fold thioesterase [Porticoccaceae bacterium]|jgi:hypothetical protein|nr:hotdog fold thioesterase [Porticoccaceae bacterium]